MSSLNISKTVATATIAVSLLSSCGRDDKDALIFPREDVRKVEIISEELPFDRAINNFCKYGDYFIVVSHDANDDWISILDSRGNIVRSGLKTGRGPSEVLHPVVDIDAGSGMMYVVDDVAGNAYSIDIDAFIDGDKDAVRPIWIPNDTMERVDKALYLGDDTWLEFYGYYLRRDTSAVKRISVFDGDGNLINGVNNFPVKEPIALGYHTSSVESKVTLSPSRRKLALGYQKGAMLEVYDVSPENGIQTSVIKKYIDLGYEGGPNNHENWNTTVEGFRQLDSSEDEIYAIFDGKTTLKEYFEDPYSYIMNKIAVFDWNAQPIRRFITDYNLSGISVEGDTAYIIVSDDMGLRFLGKVDIE